MKRWTVLVLLAAVLAWFGSKVPAATLAQADNGSAFAKSDLFDPLNGKEDVIYLCNNTSFVWGPDPHGRSEAITFTGLVTVPKWPMAGYQRRILPDGRQQIDIELTQSLLVGESYLLGGKVNLLEHPDLRSLGTITEPVQAPKFSMALPAGIRSAQNGGVRQVSFKVSDQMAKVLKDNPSVPWEALIARSMGQYTQQIDAIRSGKLQPHAEAAAATGLVELQLNLPVAVARQIESNPDIKWDIWLYEALSSVIASRPDIVVGGGQPIAGTVIPSDFVVARKVLLNTAKGLLYNETAVPVRGKLDTIPPVKTETTPRGVNVFVGMELPVPLINEAGAVDGWFYSGAHTAMSVLPKAVERATVEGTIELRNGSEVEKVAVKGPAEIHHGKTRTLANGQRETEIEVMVLGLRGHSKLLGGDVMLIEHYGVEDYLSRGRIAWNSASAGNSNFDLYVQFNTPAGVIGNNDPIPVSGKLWNFGPNGALEKGRLKLPLVADTAHYTSAAERPLYSEADKKVATLVSLDLNFTKDGAHIHPETLVHQDHAAAAAKGSGSR
jgi:hypothetical protein